MSNPVFTQVNSTINLPASTVLFNDFKRQPLLTNQLSAVGPCMAKGDVNGDGLEDLYVGGDEGRSGKLYVQNKSGNFKVLTQKVFESDLGYVMQMPCFLTPMEMAF